MIPAKFPTLNWTVVVWPPSTEIVTYSRSAISPGVIEAGSIRTVCVPCGTKRNSKTPLASVRWVTFPSKMIRALL